MNWTHEPGPVRALNEVIYFYFARNTHICVWFQSFSFQQFSVCFSALHFCPWVAVLSCCSNVLAALADTHRWLSVYLLTYGLREQCRHFTQCWQIRRGLWPRIAALKADWCLQASTWGIVLISTLILVLASALALPSRHQESSDSSWLQEFNERTERLLRDWPLFISDWVDETVSMRLM